MFQLPLKLLILNYYRTSLRDVFHPKISSSPFQLDPWKLFSTSCYRAQSAFWVFFIVEGKMKPAQFFTVEGWTIWRVFPFFFFRRVLPFFFSGRRVFPFFSSKRKKHRKREEIEQENKQNPCAIPNSTTKALAPYQQQVRII